MMAERKAKLMFRKLSLLAIALSLLGAGAALAAAPTPVPNRPPNFSSMHYLLGTWHCQQRLMNRPGNRTETDTYTMAYDGWQMQEHSVSPPFDRFRSRDQVGDAWTTWDPTVRLWINQ